MNKALDSAGHLQNGSTASHPAIPVTLFTKVEILCQYNSVMGMRQMTFDIPDEVAERFNSEVPASEQSSVVTKLLLRRRRMPALTEEQWAAACEAVNNDPDITQLERDMDALSGEGLDEYPWDEPSSR